MLGKGLVSEASEVGRLNFDCPIKCGVSGVEEGKRLVRGSHSCMYIRALLLSRPLPLGDALNLVM